MQNGPLCFQRLGFDRVQPLRPVLLLGFQVGHLHVGLQFFSLVELVLLLRTQRRVFGLGLEAVDGLERFATILFPGFACGPGCFSGMYWYSILCRRHPSGRLLGDLHAFRSFQGDLFLVVLAFRKGSCEDFLSVAD
ncbi:hypothetical protein [Prosthecobacter sp.]|uniref:hypothetical protein n=1 Tax=Prosthecobacter sp. TaxID=1965333 RepID=UPI003783167C